MFDASMFQRDRSDIGPTRYGTSSRTYLMRALRRARRCRIKCQLTSALGLSVTHVWVLTVHLMAHTLVVWLFSQCWWACVFNTPFAPETITIDDVAADGEVYYEFECSVYTPSSQVSQQQLQESGLTHEASTYARMVHAWSCVRSQIRIWGKHLHIITTQDAGVPHLRIDWLIFICWM